MQVFCKGNVMGTPNREPQEYSRNIMEDKDPGRYIPIMFLLYSWSSLFGVPIKVPLFWGAYSYYVPTIFLGFPVWGSH